VQKVKWVNLVPLGDRELMDWMVLMGKRERREHRGHQSK
jgi:hypothetical protein